MINLLPAEHKSEIRAARTNVMLVRYIVIIASAALVLAALIGGVYLVLNTAKQNAEAKAAENSQRLVAFQDIRVRADAFRSDLATAKSIMDSSPKFAKLIYSIAGSVPRNVILDNLTLDPATFGTPSTLNAKAKTFEDVTKLKNSLTANTQVFSNVQVTSAKGTSGGSTAADAYPVEIILTVTINKGAMQ